MSARKMRAGVGIASAFGRLDQAQQRPVSHTYVIASCNNPSYNFRGSVQTSILTSNPPVPRIYTLQSV